MGRRYEPHLAQAGQQRLPKGRGGRNRPKIQLGCLRPAPSRGGLEPDLLDERPWWPGDDFWWFVLASAVAVIYDCGGRVTSRFPTKSLLAERDLLTAA